MVDFNLNNARKSLAEPEIEGQDLFIKLLDEQIQRENKQEAKREYLGASYIGEGCSRNIQYKYLNTPHDLGREFKGKTLRIFQRGHAMEDWAAGWMKKAGFILKTENKNGQQFGFSTGGDKFKGHVDGILVGMKDNLKSPFEVPCLWENKAVNDKSFKDIVKKGVKASKPIYYAQIGLYQYHLNLMDNPALFTVINANTMEIHYELVEFDAEHCQQNIDKAVNVIQATAVGETLPRAFEQGSFGCRFCDFQERCWND